MMHLLYFYEWKSNCLVWHLLFSSFSVKFLPYLQLYLGGGEASEGSPRGHRIWNNERTECRMDWDGGPQCVQVVTSPRAPPKTQFTSSHVLLYFLKIFFAIKHSIFLTTNSNLGWNLQIILQVENLYRIFSCSCPLPLTDHSLCRCHIFVHWKTNAACQINNKARGSSSWAKCN